MRFQTFTFFWRLLSAQTQPFSRPPCFLRYNVYWNIIFASWAQIWKEEKKASLHNGPSTTQFWGTNIKVCSLNLFEIGCIFGYKIKYKGKFKSTTYVTTVMLRLVLWFGLDKVCKNGQGLYHWVYSQYSGQNLHFSHAPILRLGVHTPQPGFWNKKAIRVEWNLIEIRLIVLLQL